jgi:hypothetical protein
MKKYLPFITLILSATLAACGGGGSTPSDAPPETKSIVDPYVGTWTACLPVGAFDSRHVTMELSKQSDMVIAYKVTPALYIGSGVCHGTAPVGIIESGTLTFDGTTKMVSDPVSSTMVLADKITVDATEPAFGTATQVIRLNSGARTNFVLGAGGALDAQGYPDVLRSYGYFKQ